MSSTKKNNKKTTSLEYVVYIVLCKDNTLYTGMTNDLARRFEQHQAGTASRYTKAKGVKAVIFTEYCGSRSAALKREAAIKKLSTSHKLALISESTVMQATFSTKKVGAKNSKSKQS